MTSTLTLPGELTFGDMRFGAETRLEVVQLCVDRILERNRELAAILREVRGFEAKLPAKLRKLIRAAVGGPSAPERLEPARVRLRRAKARAKP